MTSLKKVLIAGSFLCSLGISSAAQSSIALVELSPFVDVKIAFVSNPMTADCKLTRSDFTQNVMAARIKAAVVSFGSADKKVMLIENSMNADDPFCLLR